MRFRNDFIVSNKRIQANMAILTVSKALFVIDQKRKRFLAMSRNRREIPCNCFTGSLAQEHYALRNGKLNNFEFY